MGSLPVLLNNPRILLLGGGSIAWRKARVLLANQVDFSMLARDYDAEFSSLDLPGSRSAGEVEPAALAPYNIIIDATGDPQVEILLQREKEKRFLLINSVDNPDACDFYFAALLNYGRLKIAVSTDGSSPTLGQVVRDRISQVIPADIATLFEEKAAERKRGSIDPFATRQQAQIRLTRVDLIGCGPGAVDLLTLQAYRCIGEAEVILYDHLIPQPILDLADVTAEKIYVGKRKQAHSLKQDEINRLLLEQAHRGKRVARLKSGDPYIFGRGAEEAEFLAQEGLQVRVIPGLSSALAGPAAVGIPLTARGYATNFSVVSAHLAGSFLNTDWLPLLRIPNHTTVVLMGLSFAEQIKDLALQSGIAGDFPVAIVSNATRPGQGTIITCLNKLADSAKQAERPAVLVFGEVVKLHQVLPHGVVL